tara:strand:+ start:18071 stop:18880 length:810 start_codon:yes stop_codon:yes gene_type:complete
MKLGNPFGIGVFVHWTFGLLLAWIGLSSLFQNGIVGAVFSILLIAALFGCVVLHELGHSLAARYFGIGTKDITLYPIGGVAKLERMPRDPAQELVIALAGPAVNVVIALLLVPVVLLLGLPDLAAAAAPASVREFVFTLLSANIILVVFNMIPAFPMDGGRVLRAVLTMYRDHRWATNIAARIGQGLAIAFGVLGLFTFNLLWIVLAAFIFLAAGAERRSALWQSQFDPQFSEPFRGPRATGQPRVVVIEEDDWDVLPPDDVVRRKVRW